MLFEILTLFPKMFEGPLSESLMGKAVSSGLIEVKLTNIRAFACGKHKVCDDSPYGGGAGMVMKPEPLVAAIEKSRVDSITRAHVILLSPHGRILTHDYARSLASHEHVVLVCGRYEGVDERVRDFVDDEVSIGDFVLSGGEPAAWVLMDAVSRFLPGVLGNEDSVVSESFSDGLLEYPQYTRPPLFRDQKVPDVLLSGDHAKIEKWRRKQSLKKTRSLRPELFERLLLSEEDKRLLVDEDPS